MNAVGRIRELEERVKKLEGQRQMWWRRAWYAAGIVTEYDKARGEDMIEDWDKEQPK